MYKIGQKLYSITLNKVVDAQSDLYKNGVHVEEYKIIGINELRICIDNRSFRSYTTKKGRHGFEDSIDVIYVNIKTKDDYFGKGIFTRILSSKPPTKKLLNKMLNDADKKIEKTFSFLGNGVKNDLKNSIEQWEEKATTSK